jgi:acyl carrier protein
MTIQSDEIRSSLRDALDRASNGRAKLAQMSDDAKIIEDIGLSSLDILDLRCELQDRWKTKIADAELLQMRTVGDIVALIQKRISPVS